MSNIELTPEDMRKEEIFNDLLEGDVEKLKHIHAEQYSGTDDDMSDDFESWLVDLTSDEIIDYLK